MTAAQIEYIVAVDTYRSFARAAEKCFISQPAMSFQIQKVEKELGVKLFDRSKQPVMPTEIGKEIIVQARRALQEHHRISEIVEGKRGVIQGELRLGVIPTLAPYLLPIFLLSFLKQYPHIKLTVAELTTVQIITQLRSELLDCGILATPLAEGNLTEHPLFYEPFVAYTSPSSPLFNKTIIRPDDMDIHETWLLSEGHCMRSQVINLCKEKRQYLDYAEFEYQTGSMETLIKIVEMGKGVTILPELATLDFSAKQKKLIRRFRQPEPVREISLVTHRNFLKQRLVEALKETVLKSVPKAMWSKTKKAVVKITSGSE
ncbi:MAG: hydrogen peroxide-inducible genes activator [Rhizobacter sp.]|nr:hydrogen peroxide-inducible genes activator [Chlorobiales bacterium]